MRPFLLVGLTGGIATGKSTVSAMLRELGCVIIDADLLAREVVEPGEPAYRDIVAEFGSEVVQPDGSLDRKKLGAVVFTDPERRRRLEAITHPRIRERVARRLQALTDEGFTGLVIFDAPVMIESGNYRNVDRLVVVATDEATQHARLRGRDGASELEAARRIASQMPVKEKAALADYVVDNAGDRAATLAQVKRVHAALLADLRARHGIPGAVISRGRRRALGQHFLRDGGIARAIVDAVAPRSTDLVVEIGPGQGALTGELARRAGRMIALEIDPTLVRTLRTRLPSVEVIEADARSWPYGSLVRPPGGRVLVVGNLPYSTGTAILMTLIETRSAIDEIVVMLQREVAERVAAAPGSKSYGSLSVLVQLVADPVVLLRVPPGAFRPPPKVESALLRVTILPAPRASVPDEERFRAVVRAAFAQRRKTIANSLAAALALSSARVHAALLAVEIDPIRRAETLTLEEFARLAPSLPEPQGAPRPLPE